MRTIPDLKEGTHRAVTTGSLPNGKPVVVNADGTVSVVSETSASLGSAVVFEAAAVSHTGSGYDVNADRMVIAYKDEGNSSYGTVVVGTVSGTSISFGTPVVFHSQNSDYISVVYDSNAQKTVIVYRDPISGAAEAVVGTVSGTSISFGTAVPTAGGSQDVNYVSAAYDANAQKIVVAYQNKLNSNYGSAAVGTVSGTSISFGSVSVFNTAQTDEISCAYDASAQKVVIAYQDAGNSDYGTAVVSTISGTSISFGSEVVFNSGSTSLATQGVTYDASAEKIVIAFRDIANSSFGTAIVGAVSGTSISFGSEVVFNSGSSASCTAIYDPASRSVVIAYRDQGNSNVGTFVLGTVSGTSISFGSEVVFEAGASNHFSSAQVGSGKVVIAYQDAGNSDHGTAIVSQNEATNLTSENYIGISTGGTYADGSSATVDIIGTVNGQQSGLTAGQSYYVQTDGTLSETPDDPEVFAGTAISATSLVVKT